MASETEIASIRANIVALARSFVADSHYLWGTAGNTPGGSEGNPGGGKTRAAKLRTITLDPKATARDQVIAVCTAVQDTFSGYNTCAGRCDRYNFAPTDEDFQGYLTNRQADSDACKVETFWEGLGAKKNLHPRKYYFQDALKTPKGPVWGESCIKRRHFDCVGLVNYCYAQYWYKKQFGIDIPVYRNANQGFKLIQQNAPCKDADVVIKPDNKHIAMIYSDGDVWKVVQAANTETGLTDSERYDPSAWDRYRAIDAFLKDPAK